MTRTTWGWRSTTSPSASASSRPIASMWPHAGHERRVVDGDHGRGARGRRAVRSSQASCSGPTQPLGESRHRVVEQQRGDSGPTSMARGQPESAGKTSARLAGTSWLPGRSASGAAQRLEQLGQVPVLHERALVGEVAGDDDEVGLRVEAVDVGHRVAQVRRGVDLAAQLLARDRGCAGRSAARRRSAARYATPRGYDHSSH